MRTILPLSLGVLVGALGCGDETRLSVSTDFTSPVSSAMLTVTVTDGDRRFTWRGTDFRSRPPGAIPTTIEAILHPGGPDILVTFRLEDGAELLSEGSISLPRQTDWRWGVTISNTTSDPRRQCFGCFGSVAFDLAASHRVVDHDSTWVVWGGNSISNPGVY